MVGLATRALRSLDREDGLVLACDARGLRAEVARGQGCSRPAHRISKWQDAYEEKEDEFISRVNAESHSIAAVVEEGLRRQVALSRP